MASNLSMLTSSHKIIASKKRAKREQIKEVVFDDTARREFLTGFHKRKLEKKELAKKKAVEREKQERLEARREKRILLAEQAANNAKEVEKAYGATIDSEDENGVSDVSGKGKGKAQGVEDEYEDEEQLATVTVVEDFDPQALLHGSPASKSDAVNHNEPSSEPLRSRSDLPKAPSGVRKTQTKAVKKAKDIKYQTKAARKADRHKQLKRKIVKAERAGGKSSRLAIKTRGKR